MAHSIYCTTFLAEVIISSNYRKHNDDVCETLLEMYDWTEWCSSRLVLVRVVAMCCSVYRSIMSIRRRCKLSSTQFRARLLTTSWCCRRPRLRSVWSARDCCGVWLAKDCAALNADWRRTRSVKTCSTQTVFNVRLALLVQFFDRRLDVA